VQSKGGANKSPRDRSRRAREEGRTCKKRRGGQGKARATRGANGRAEDAVAGEKGQVRVAVPPPASFLYSVASGDGVVRAWAIVLPTMRTKDREKTATGGCAQGAPSHPGPSCNPHHSICIFPLRSVQFLVHLGRREIRRSKGQLGGDAGSRGRKTQA
jgi:hypothetical protein